MVKIQVLDLIKGLALLAMWRWMSITLMQLDASKTHPSVFYFEAGIL